MAVTKVNKTATKQFSALHQWVYRTSGGRLGGSMGGAQVVLVTTKGRKSGTEHTVPVYAVPHAAGWAMVASFSGHDAHPAWYLNLLAQPESQIQVGGESHRTVMRQVEGDERDEVWGKMVAMYPAYAEYQAATQRRIPVVVLEPARQRA